MNARIQNILWYLAPLLVTISKWMRGSNTYNNYLIYKNVFWHTIHQSNLYADYPKEYFDHNLYGPLFAIIIAPFAILPDLLGLLGWSIFSMWILQKGLSYFWGEKPPVVLFLLVLLEAVTSLHNFQFNILIAGGLLLAFGLLRKENILLSTLLIIVLILTKIYGIVGLILVLFTDKPLKFIANCLLWTVILLILPAVLSNPSFLYQSYFDWYQTIIHKNDLNQLAYAKDGMQDISFMGLVKRISGKYELSNLIFLIPAAILSVLPFFRFNSHKNGAFQLEYFAQVLIGLVIFSSSSESSTYIIAIVAYAIWMLDKFKEPKYIGLLVGMFLITVLSPTDLVPTFIRKEYIVKYALKALPPVLAWIWITKNLLFNSYNSSKHES